MLRRIGRWVQKVRELPDRMDRRLAFAVPLWSYWLLLGITVVTLALAYQHAVSVAASTKVGPYMGLGGALTACIGALALARPIIRAGGYKAWHEHSRAIDGGTFVITPEQIREAKEGLLDARAVNVLAPAFGIVGTIINGASGFFS